MTRHALFVLAIGLLMSCTGTTDRYVVTSPQATERQRIAYRSVEIRDVSLPAYAADDEIVRSAADGRLISDSALWADTPDRSVALELSRHLSQITGARIASSPWPFETLPDARLDVRFETFVASADGQYRASGQYFVAVGDGRPERAGLFDLSVPFDPEAGTEAVATARGQLVLDLAGELARRALR
jgi:uncharacterized lipoprotein YmbA